MCSGSAEHQELNNNVTQPVPFHNEWFFRMRGGLRGQGGVLGVSGQEGGRRGGRWGAERRGAKHFTAVWDIQHFSGTSPPTESRTRGTDAGLACGLQDITIVT